MTSKSPSLLQGTLDMIVLQLLRSEPTNGYELAQRIEAISHEVLSVNAGSLYPALYRLEAKDLIKSAWEDSKTGRRVKVYSLTRTGRKQLAREEAQWQRSTGIIARFFNISEEPA